jgi:hypothetical protein
LLDPQRAPYVRAVLRKKQLAAEQRACSGADPVKHQETLDRLAAVIAMASDDAEGETP